MRASEIAVGMRCWTKVSGDRVEVEVVSDNLARGRRYLCKRTDNGKLLTSRRAGTALHPGKYVTAPGAFDRSRPSCYCGSARATHYHDPKTCPANPLPRAEDPERIHLNQVQCGYQDGTARRCCLIVSHVEPHAFRA